MPTKDDFDAVCGLLDQIFAATDQLIILSERIVHPDAEDYAIQLGRDASSWHDKAMTILAQARSTEPNSVERIRLTAAVNQHFAEMQVWVDGSRGRLIEMIRTGFRP